MNAQKLQNQFKSFNLEITQLEEFSDTVEFNYTTSGNSKSAVLFFNPKTETVEQKLKEFFMHVRASHRSSKQDANDIIKSVSSYQEKLALTEHFRKIHALMAIHPELEIEPWEEVDHEEIEYFANFQMVEQSLRNINTQAAHPNRNLKTLFTGAKS